MKPFSLVKILCLSLVTHYAACNSEIRMSYSDLISNKLQEFLYEDIISYEKNFEADLNNLAIYKSGSLPMIEDFLSDELDLCILTLPENIEFPALEDKEIIKIPFCYKSSVIIVNKENPITEVDIKQLEEMFSNSTSNSNLKTWRDFGVSSFTSSKIKAYAVKEENGISSDLFRHCVMGSNLFNASVTFGTKENVQALISQDKAAVGIFPTVPENPNLKALFVAEDSESIAYGPSIDNIYYLDYPIRLPFVVLFKSKDLSRLFPLINTLFSDQISDILEDNNFYPLPKIIREKFIIDFQLEMQKGQK